MLEKRLSELEKCFIEFVESAQANTFDLSKGFESYFRVGNCVVDIQIFNPQKTTFFTFGFHNYLINEKMLLEKFPAWGKEYFLKNRLNVVAISCIETPNWYREKELIDFLPSLLCFRKNLSRVVGYGGSMGAFGAATFAQTLDFDSVLLLNPLSTLNKRCAPWEDRFEFDRKRLSWEGPFHDAAVIKLKGIICYDPFFSQDRLHAERFEGLSHLKLPFVGHGIGAPLAQLGILNKIVESMIVSDSYDAHEFAKQARSRRRLNVYYETLSKKCLTPRNIRRRETIQYYKELNLKNSDT